MASDGGRLSLPQQQTTSPRDNSRASAITAGLDDDLQRLAETAIVVFRSSFEAALAEGSPHLRQRLRQAASDLMRVAARTTMVLDRLNTATERGSARGEGQFWPENSR